MLSRSLFVVYALLLSLALAPVAQAHEDVTAGDFLLTIGWETEPPVADVMNGVTLRIMGPPPSLRSPDLDAGGSWSHTFTQVGTLEYHCHQHPWMGGNVTVEKPMGMKMEPKTVMVKMVEGGGPSEYRFEPENVTIHPGDTIMWMNAGQMVHSVHEGSGASMMGMDHGGGDHGDGGMGHGGGMDGGMEHGDGGHMHGAGSEKQPVMGVADDLTLKVTHGDRSQTFTLVGVEGHKGLYIARFIPTLPGFYEANVTGTLHGVEIAFTAKLQTVDAIGDHQFPVKTPSSSELDEKLTTLQAEARTQSETPAPVADATPSNDVPSVGALGIVAVGVAAALAFARRSRR